MTDYAGPLQRLVLSRTLWLLVVWPVAGFGWQVLVARPAIARARADQTKRRAERSARGAGLGFVALTTASVLAHAIILVRLPPASRVLFQKLVSGVSIGQVDAGVAFLFDPLSAAFCTLACAVALAVSVLAAPGLGAGWRWWAWTQLSFGGALVSFVADGFPGTAAGWAIAGAAAAWLSGWHHGAKGIVTALRVASGIAAMLVGAALVLWGLGGSWDGDDYVPSSQPRLAAVRVGDSVVADSDPENSASLTLTSLSGAAVFVDDARAPSMRSPFVEEPIRAGVHTLRIHSGDGSNDEVLGRVVFLEGEEIALVPTGPTLTFRSIGDQLSLRDRDGRRPARSALGERSGPAGPPAGVSALMALLVAAAAVGGVTPSRNAPTALAALAQGATTSALGPYLIARAAWLLPLAPGTWIAVESLGAVLLVGAGWRAPTGIGIGRWLSFVGMAPPALAYLALGAMGVAAGACVFVLTGAATAALYIAASTQGGEPPLPAETTGSGIGSAILVAMPARLGTLVASMDRWVVTAIAATLAAGMRLGGWVLFFVDEHFVARPAHLVALRLVRVGRGVEPTFGVTMGRVTWCLLAAAAFAAFAQAFWQGR